MLAGLEPPLPLKFTGHQHVPPASHGNMLQHASAPDKGAEMSPHGPELRRPLQGRSSAYWGAAAIIKAKMAELASGEARLARKLLPRLISMATVARTRRQLRKKAAVIADMIFCR